MWWGFELRTGAMKGKSLSNGLHIRKPILDISALHRGGQMLLLAPLSLVVSPSQTRMDVFCLPSAEHSGLEGVLGGMKYSRHVCRVNVDMNRLFHYSIKFGKAF